MVFVCYGTRPEVIKIASVVKALQQEHIPFRLVFTGQHQNLYEDVKHLLPPPDYDLQVMRPNQTVNYVLSAIIRELDELLRKEKPQLIMVQGDTTTVLASALAAFNNRIAVGHIEAGLRTYNLESPFPEEANRQLVSRIARFNWAPTEWSAENLRREGLQNIEVTGNTVVDTCRSFDFPISYGNKVLITLHRRENFGEKMRTIFQQIEDLAQAHPELTFVFPMHPNPEVQRHKSIFKAVQVLRPLGYDDMMKMLSEVRFVISDSGGLQEECAAFGKKILVCRDTSERPEGMDAGFAKLVGTDVQSWFDWANDDPVWKGDNPYGDGAAGRRIAQSVSCFLKEMESKGIAPLAS